MSSAAQIAANRLNGLKGGVRTDEGKAISRLNALKHGIFATALMECPSDGYFAALLDELNAELKPVGIVEQLLVDKLAVTYLRMRRCAQADSLRFENRWKFKPEDFGKFPYDEAVVAIGLYDTRLTKQFLRLLSEIEHRQKQRKSAAGHGTDYGRARECRMQSAECRTTEGNGPLQTEESSPELDGKENVKNEPNSAVSPVEPPTTTRETLDSRLRGNDGAQAGHSAGSGQGAAVLQEPKNEPNSAAGAAQPPSAAQSGLDSRLRGNDKSQTRVPLPQETKNEPNFQIAECRVPISECDDNAKNEPNSLVALDRPSSAL